MNMEQRIPSFQVAAFASDCTVLCCNWYGLVVNRVLFMRRLNAACHLVQKYGMWSLYMIRILS